MPSAAKAAARSIHEVDERLNPLRQGMMIQYGRQAAAAQTRAACEDALPVIRYSGSVDDRHVAFDYMGE